MRGSRAHLTEEEKQNKVKITWPLLKRIFSYLIPYWFKLLLIAICIFVSSLLGLTPSLLTGRMIDEGLIGQNFELLVQLVMVSVLVLVFSNLINILQSWLNNWVAQHITYDMRNQMYAHLQSMSHRFFSSSKQGEIITRMTSDISGVQSVISGTLTNILSNITVLITSIVAMYNKNWILATIGLMIVPLLIIPTKFVGKARWKIALESQKKNDEVNQILNETLNVSGQMLVKLFVAEKREYEKYESANYQMSQLNIKESLAGRWFRAAMNFFLGIGPILIYLVGGYLIIKRGYTTLSVGDLTVIVSLLSRMYRPVDSLMNVQVEVVRSMALFSRIFEYFDLKPEIVNASDAVSPKKCDGVISFENVSFEYNEGQPILKGIDFTIEKGKSVAIVGPSGSGKSTLINLIPRLYDVTGGSVKIDNVDVKKLDLNWLRNHIGVVMQETYLFNGTIKENLLYAKEEATLDELINACTKANIYEFIKGLPLGFDTEVGNRGVKLSGGEKQRISIARAILKNPDILLLDEATSALDSISESMIQDAIDPLLEGRTSVIIAHRLSTIMAADEILVLKEGEIVERGTHNELLEIDGVYRLLYETQFRKALDECKCDE